MPGEVSTVLFFGSLGVLTFSLVSAVLLGGGMAVYRLVRTMQVDFAADLARARSDCEREIQDLRSANQAEIGELTGRILSLETTLAQAMRLMGDRRGGLEIAADEVTIGGDVSGRDAIRALTR